MKRILVVGSLGGWMVGGALFLQACGGDDSVKNDGGTDATIDDTGTGTDTSTGMDGDTDGGTGMDGSMMGTEGGTGPNPGKVNCGTMLDCDAGGSGCCVRFFQDGGQSFQCLPQGQCGGGGVRWECDERADCTNNEYCCITAFQGVVTKSCNGFCFNGSHRACKSSGDCVDGGACNTYTCPGNIVIQSCTKPQACN